MQPYDLTTGMQLPRFTNAALTMNTDPLHPGKVVVFFDSATSLDADSFYVGRRPALGVDPDALVLWQKAPGIGLLPVPFDALFLSDRIVLTPTGGYAPTLPTGQYTVRVGSIGQSLAGLSVAPAPVFHTFFVSSDPIEPYVRATDPGDGAAGVAGDATIIVRFTEGIDASTLDAVSIHVEHLGALAVTTLPAATGYPQMQTDADGATLPSNGHVVHWRARDPLPTSGAIRVTVGNGAALGGTDLLDLNGNAMSLPYAFTFRAGP